MVYSIRPSLHSFKIRICNEKPEVPGSVVRLASFSELQSIDLTDYSLDELCQIHSRLLELVSEAFHRGEDAQGGYITLLCDKIMAEIKNQLLYMAI